MPPVWANLPADPDSLGHTTNCPPTHILPHRLCWACLLSTQLSHIMTSIKPSEILEWECLVSQSMCFDWPMSIPKGTLFPIVHHVWPRCSYEPSYSSPTTFNSPWSTIRRHCESCVEEYQSMWVRGSLPLSLLFSISGCVDCLVWSVPLTASSPVHVQCTQSELQQQVGSPTARSRLDYPLKSFTNTSSVLDWACLASWTNGIVPNPAHLALVAG